MPRKPSYAAEATPYPGIPGRGAGARAGGARLPGHAVRQPGRWIEGRDPWTLTADGDRWYGRGAADDKGQHLVNLAALRLLLAEQGSLGFNLTFLFESGEETGSPGLAEFTATHRELPRADVLVASDGPRLDTATPTLFHALGRPPADNPLSARS
ncbi:M20/M25/M40 family metallo-hydrolase [Streptomyces dysideae]|uniref:M20/M25/M40 family metallo-hydrolase n=1 Tax=Streptomyces dysideae TaxID=909626 RepID=UPI001F426EA8|nr:M20/M25/M40 family metallo-hydrolase [Streptomyces dysideae]